MVFFSSIRRSIASLFSLRGKISDGQSTNTTHPNGMGGLEPRQFSHPRSLGSGASGPPRYYYRDHSTESPYEYQLDRESNYAREMLLTPRMSDRKRKRGVQSCDDPRLGIREFSSDDLDGVIFADYGESCFKRPRITDVLERCIPNEYAVSTLDSFDDDSLGSYDETSSSSELTGGVVVDDDDDDDDSYFEAYELHCQSQHDDDDENISGVPELNSCSVRSSLSAGLSRTSEPSFIDDDEENISGVPELNSCSVRSSLSGGLSRTSEPSLIDDNDENISGVPELNSCSVRSSLSAGLSGTSESSLIDDYESISSFSSDCSLKAEPDDFESPELKLRDGYDNEVDCNFRDNTEENVSDDNAEQKDPGGDRREDADETTSKFDLEKAKRWAHAVKLPQGKWADAERDLFFRLAMRGFEPVVPSNWKLDFKTLPESLFSARNADDSIISSMSDNEFRGIKSLINLFSLGQQVRDRQLALLRPEPIIKRGIRRYIDWAMKDACLHNRPNVIPLYAIYGLRRHQSTKEALEILSIRLMSLANRYRESWKLTPSVEVGLESGQRYAERTFPVLTGFLICGSIVALITLNSDPGSCPAPESNAKPRLIGKFDFGDRADDVWNALALAIAVIRDRKTMLQLEEEGEGEPMWIEGPNPNTIGDEDA